MFFVKYVILMDKKDGVYGVKFLFKIEDLNV